MSNPWDIRDGEPPEAYARFLTFRNLGPGRSLSLANNIHGGATKRRKSPYPSGQWIDDSAKHGWCARAVAWDIEQLSKHGEELVRLWMGLVLSAARKAAEKLADPKCVPANFREALAVIEKLAPYLTPEVVSGLANTTAENRSDRERAITFRNGTDAGVR